MTDQLPDRLYHYTSAEGLLGIVSGGQFFATDLRFLNDARELTFARDLVVARLEQAASDLEAEPDESDGGRVEARLNLMRSCIYEATKVTEWLQIFVTCFCEEGDLLSQWRGYGQLAGYALGFDTAALDASTATTVKLRQVVYGDESVPLLQQMIDSIINFPPRAHAGSRGALMVERDVVPAVVHVKEGAFREEREWRLSTTRYTYNALEDEVQHRAGRLSITPYLGLTFDAAALREVRIGPGPYPLLRQQGVRSFLAGQGRGEVEVTLSCVAETFR